MNDVETFPPYALLDTWAQRAAGETRKLERLYHNTQAYAWDPRAVLDELVAKHGGIHVGDDKREALGHLFTVLLWGELAAWNIAADLARALLLSHAVGDRRAGPRALGSVRVSPRGSPRWGQVGAVSGRPDPR